MRKLFGRRALALLHCVGLVTTILLVASFWRVWFLEVFVSFAPQVLAASLAIYLAFGLRLLYLAIRNTKPSLAPLRYLIIPALGFVSIFTVGTLRTYDEPVTADNTQDSDLVIATYNKHIVAPDTDDAVNLFLDLEVDVLFLQETTPPETAELARRLDFDHIHSTDNNQDLGDTDLAIISRYRLDNRAAIRAIPDRRQNILRAVIEVDSQPIALYNTHLATPLSPRKYEFGTQHLDLVTDLLTGEDLPTIFGGDLNTTSYSPDLRRFNSELASLNIHSTTHGFVSTCSWNGVSSLLCLRLDHLYISDELTLSSAALSPELESDHKAVVLELGI